MSISENALMSIGTFLNTAQILPCDVSVLLRAPHGVGKSQIVRQLSKKLDKIENLEREIIDRRLSQMSEGDMIGLPSTDNETTRFNPPDWYKRACDTPCTLFLDELNRATPEVMQAAFQIVLDRELNGWKLHPKTRVYSAINMGASYMINEMDPALLDRFFVCDLSPTVDEWISWARETGRIHETIIDWIATNRAFADPAPKSTPGSVQPSRRSLEKLSYSLINAGIVDKPNHPQFYSMSLGFMGLEAAQSFLDYAKNNDLQIDPEVAIVDWKKCSKKFKKLSADRQLATINKVVEFYLHLNDAATLEGAKQITAMVKDSLPEHYVSAWTKISKCGNHTIIKYFVDSGYTALVASQFKLETDKKADATTP